MSEQKSHKRLQGDEVFAKLFRRSPQLPNWPERFIEHTFEHLFGDVWTGTDLDLPERSLITCSVLVALGREAEQKLHFVGAKNLGVPREKLEEMIGHVAHYAGWPVAVAAYRNLNDVWPKSDDN